MQKCEGGGDNLFISCRKIEITGFFTMVIDNKHLLTFSCSTATGKYEKLITIYMPVLNILEALKKEHAYNISLSLLMFYILLSSHNR